MKAPERILLIYLFINLKPGQVDAIESMPFD